MFLSIERFDNDYAICEDDDENWYSFKKSKLPKNVQPGDILRVSANGNLHLDMDETLQRKKQIKMLQDRLFNVD